MSFLYLLPPVHIGSGSSSCHCPAQTWCLQINSGLPFHAVLERVIACIVSLPAYLMHSLCGEGRGEEGAGGMHCKELSKNSASEVPHH